MGMRWMGIKMRSKIWNNIFLFQLFCLFFTKSNLLKLEKCWTFLKGTNHAIFVLVMNSWWWNPLDCSSVQFVFGLSCCRNFDWILFKKLDTLIGWILGSINSVTLCLAFWLTFSLFSHASNSLSLGNKPSLQQITMLIYRNFTIKLSGSFLH